MSLHSVDSKAGVMVPPPFGQTAHGARPGVVRHLTAELSVLIG